MKIVHVKLGVTELKLYFKITFNPKCLFQKKKRLEINKQIIYNRK